MYGFVIENAKFILINVYDDPIYVEQKLNLGKLTQPKVTNE